MSLDRDIIYLSCQILLGQTIQCLKPHWIILYLQVKLQNPEYFENSENREILLAWKQVDDQASFKEKLDASLWEHLDSLISKNILATQIEERYNDYVLSLKREYYRSIERKKEAALVSEAEAGGTAAELAKLEEQGIEASRQLGEIFTQKAGRGREQRR